MLEKELETYNKVKADLQQRYSTGYVVILGEEVLGVWQARVDALRAGFEKYGNIQFLVKDIRERSSMANYSRNIEFV